MAARKPSISLREERAVTLGIDIKNGLTAKNHFLLRQRTYEAGAPYLTAIDPGVNNLGVSIWDIEKQVLKWAGLIEHHPIFKSHPKVVGIVRSIVAYQNDMGEYIVDMMDSSREIVIEMPQVYTDTRSWKGDPGDILKLTLTVGALMERFSTLKTWRNNSESEITLVRPQKWKGQLPKEVTARRVKKKLDPQEKELVELPDSEGLDHNVFDAIGIGLWALDRW